MDFKERDPKLEKHLDEWLDDALAGYSKADPRPGLEQRITTTLRAQSSLPPEPSRRSNRRLAATSRPSTCTPRPFRPPLRQRS